MTTNGTQIELSLKVRGMWRVRFAMVVLQWALGRLRVEVKPQ